jgi:hypothetical protein
MGKKCENCDKRAYYNLEGQHEKYCTVHKTALMINVYNLKRVKKCEFPNCKVLYPDYNIEGWN